ncbi:Putative uncharacterized transposon-derived protein, partial [Frankliniella fusca]
MCITSPLTLRLTERLGNSRMLRSLKKDNDGFSYILCVIDVFSKFAWAVPLKDKS